MSKSAFDMDEEFDFDAQFNSSLGAAENQEGDVGAGFPEEDVAPEEEYQQPVAAPVAYEEPEAVEEYEEYEEPVEEYAPEPVQRFVEEEEEEEFLEPQAEETNTVYGNEYETTEYQYADEAHDDDQYVVDHTAYTAQSPGYAEPEVYQAPEPVYAQPAPVERTQHVPVSPAQQQSYAQPPAPAPVVSVEDELEAEDHSRIEDQANGAHNIKSGIDNNVSLETLEESFKILDAYRSLESDEQEFAAIFMDLGDEAKEPEIVSTVMNANPLLFKVFSSIEEAYTLDDTEIAFYIVGLHVSVIEGISYVASSYLSTSAANPSQKKIPYAREVVAQLRAMDDRALRLVSAAHSLIKGEALSENDRLSH